MRYSSPVLSFIIGIIIMPWVHFFFISIANQIKWKTQEEKLDVNFCTCAFGFAVILLNSFLKAFIIILNRGEITNYNDGWTLILSWVPSEANFHHLMCVSGYSIVKAHSKIEQLDIHSGKFSHHLSTLARSQTIFFFSLPSHSMFNIVCEEISSSMQ